MNRKLGIKDISEEEKMILLIKTKITLEEHLKISTTKEEESLSLEDGSTSRST